MLLRLCGNTMTMTESLPAPADSAWSDFFIPLPDPGGGSGLRELVLRSCHLPAAPLALASLAGSLTLLSLGMCEGYAEQQGERLQVALCALPPAFAIAVLLCAAAACCCLLPCSMAGARAALNQCKQSLPACCRRAAGPGRRAGQADGVAAIRTQARGHDNRCAAPAVPCTLCLSTGAKAVKSALRPCRPPADALPSCPPAPSPVQRRPPCPRSRA